MLLPKDLIRATQAKNEQLVNNINDTIINLTNVLVIKESSSNKNPKKWSILLIKFSQQQNDKGRPRLLDSVPWNLSISIKVLTPKQILQSLAIAFPQVKAVNRSKNY